MPLYLSLAMHVDSDQLRPTPQVCQLLLNVLQVVFGLEKLCSLGRCQVECEQVQVAVLSPWVASFSFLSVVVNATSKAASTAKAAACACTSPSPETTNQ